MDKTLQQRFLKELSDQVLQQDVNGSKKEKDCFIRLRFHPSNYEIDNKNQEKNDLLKLMEAEINYSPTNIQRTQSQVIDAFIHQYHAEMVEDQVDIESLKNPKRGDRGIWQKVYHWLWSYKFPRWLFNHHWQQLQSQASSQQNWIQFLPTERGMVWRQTPNNPPTIPCKKPLQIKLTLEYQNHYLLLLNRGLNTGFVVCPSSAFAPDFKINQCPILLPQSGSLADKENSLIEFDEPGTEEYLGIVLEQPIEIAGLKINPQEELPELNSDRMTQLWQQLEQQKNWRVFHQSFQVVKPQA